MRFPTSFSRWKGAVPAGGVALGGDSVPNGAQGADGTPPAPSQSNVLFARFANSAGWPIHRIALAYNYRGAGAAIDLPASVYLWDENARRWFLVSAVTLKEGQIVFSDSVALIDAPMQAANQTTPSAGSLSALVIVTDPGAAPNGEHRILLGCDLSLF